MQGQGNCAPNPAVGCVIVLNDTVIGRGFHRGPGLPHAEVEAISQVGDQDLSQATLYCTLEPCCHFGKTPPCTNLILEKKIGHVVYAFRDPNPIVAGKGHQTLAAAGVKVDYRPVELIEEFYNSYRTWTTQRRPFATYKVAMSLNGKIAGRDGETISITGDHGFEWTHKNRHCADAILTSVTTVTNDDPQFTVRLARGEEKKPVYVLDTRLSIPLTARLFQTAKELVLFIGPGVAESKIKAAQAKGATVIQIPSDFRGLNLRTALSVIGERGVHDLWIEGGGRMLRSMLQEKLIDRLHLLIAPTFLPGDCLNLLSDVGTEFDARKQFDGFEWRQINGVGLCTMEKKQN